MDQDSDKSIKSCNSDSNDVDFYWGNTHSYFKVGSSRGSNNKSFPSIQKSGSHYKKFSATPAPSTLRLQYLLKLGLTHKEAIFVNDLYMMRYFSTNFINENKFSPKDPSPLPLHL